MELMGAGHSVSLATVYRNLQVLESDGVVDSMRTEGAETIYRVCGQKEHHHHLVCRSCGASTIVQKPDFERWAESVASDAGFTETTHNLEFIGLCPACSN
jgi:Fur family ferric uptake transcriptional regulator